MHLIVLTPDLSFFFNDPATTEIYTLSLHDALPISQLQRAHGQCLHPQVPLRRLPGQDRHVGGGGHPPARAALLRPVTPRDRKSTRLNSSHSQISYAVFCLKKKKNKTMNNDDIKMT